MTRNSIRLRLLLVAILSIVATIAVAGASLVVFFERQVLRYVEQDLNNRWTELATAFGTEGESGIGQKLTDPRYHQPYGGAYWQVSEKGRPVMRSRSLWDDDLPLAGPRAEGDRAFEVDGPNGSELYVIEREVTVEDAKEPRAVSLAVALDHGQIVELRQAFGWDVNSCPHSHRARSGALRLAPALPGPASAAGRWPGSQRCSNRTDPAHDPAIAR